VQHPPAVHAGTAVPGPQLRDDTPWGSRSQNTLGGGPWSRQESKVLLRSVSPIRLAFPYAPRSINQRSDVVGVPRLLAALGGHLPCGTPSFLLPTRCSIFHPESHSGFKIYSRTVENGLPCALGPHPTDVPVDARTSSRCHYSCSVRQHPGHNSSDVTKLGLNPGSPPMTILSSDKPHFLVISALSGQNGDLWQFCSFLHFYEKQLKTPLKPPLGCSTLTTFTIFSHEIPVIPDITSAKQAYS